MKKALENVTPTSIKTTEKVETTTTRAPPAIVKKEKHHSGVAGVAEHLKMSDDDMKNFDGVNERPSGAILSLTLGEVYCLESHFDFRFPFFFLSKQLLCMILGMCITAIMITLVGCRLRVVRKRMRRSGKSPYAHDADFLVNGMYL